MALLNEVEDPRRPSNGTLHNFQEILVIALCAVLSDADNVDDFATWARTKEAWLRRFLVLKNGISSQDTFLRVFGALDPKQFEAVFRRWVSGIVPALSQTIAVDGKTLRGSGKGADSPVHRVSAFATDLGQPPPLKASLEHVQERAPDHEQIHFPRFCLLADAF